jgi:hypothetical protein
MRHTKTLGLAASALTVLLALTGSAQATILTSPAGTQLGVGAQIHAASEGHTVLDGSLTVECESTVTGEIDEIVNEIPTGAIDELTFDECTNKRTATVLDPGSFEIHTAEEESGNGTLTSDGTEVTVLAHLPFSITTHCIFFTENTDIGRVTGSATTEGTATLHIDSAPIERRSTDFGCGSTSEWTGSYEFTSPDFLDIENAPKTTLTSPAGKVLGLGAKFHASAKPVSEEASAFEIHLGNSSMPYLRCNSATLQGLIEKYNEKGAIEGPVQELTPQECSLSTVTVVNPGRFEIQKDSEGVEGNGILVSSGLEITVLTHLPFSFTMHCIYKTKNPTLGTLEGNKNLEGNTATVNIEAAIFSPATDFFCGQEPKLTTRFVFSTPDYLDVD